MHRVLKKEFSKRSRYSIYVDYCFRGTVLHLRQLGFTITAFEGHLIDQVIHDILNKKRGKDNLPDSPGKKRGKDDPADSSNQRKPIILITDNTKDFGRFAPRGYTIFRFKKENYTRFTMDKLANKIADSIRSPKYPLTDNAIYKL